MPLIKRCAADPDLPPAPRVALVAALCDGTTPAERRNAARDLAADVAADDALATALLAEHDPSVQAAILASLVSIGGARAAAGLAAAAEMEDALLRNAAIEALRQLGPLALPHAELLMRAPHPEPRICAVLLIGTLDDPRAHALLRDALEDDPDINVGLAAVEALSLSGGPEDLAALRRFAGRFPDDACTAFAVDLACRRVVVRAAE
jgi:HEAT repeat protein